VTSSITAILASIQKPGKKNRWKSKNVYMNFNVTDDLGVDLAIRGIIGILRILQRRGLQGWIQKFSERGRARGFWGRKSPSGVQRHSPGSGLGMSLKQYSCAKTHLIKSRTFNGVNPHNPSGYAPVRRINASYRRIYMVAQNSKSLPIYQ